MTDREIRQATWEVIDAMRLNSKIRSATKYLDLDLVVRSVKRRPKSRKNENFEVVLKIGKPNFAEKQFIKLCQKANVFIPVKEIQLRWWK